MQSNTARISGPLRHFHLPASRRSLTVLILIGSGQFRAHRWRMAQPVREIRACENCHAEMQPLGNLPAIGAKPLITVFCCYACRRIEAETQPLTFSGFISPHLKTSSNSCC